MVGRCGVNQDTGEIDPNMDIEDSGAAYSAGANYIVFRDIDLNDLNGTAGASNWSPLTFSGAMIGAKSEKGEALWDETASNITATGRPIIRTYGSSKTPPWTWESPWAWAFSPPCKATPGR